jgi:hypothetical protein
MAANNNKFGISAQLSSATLVRNTRVGESTITGNTTCVAASDTCSPGGRRGGIGAHTEVFVHVFGEGNVLMPGVLLILVMLFMPEGLVGRVHNTWRLPFTGSIHRQLARFRTASKAARASATTRSADNAVSLPPRLRIRPSMTTVSTFSGSADPMSR